MQLFAVRCENRYSPCAALFFCCVCSFVHEICVLVALNKCIILNNSVGYKFVTRMHIKLRKYKHQYMSLVEALCSYF